MTAIFTFWGPGSKKQVKLSTYFTIGSNALLSCILTQIVPLMKVLCKHMKLRVCVQGDFNETATRPPFLINNIGT